ncbi:MAG: Gfo/Idh/MocA family oxidoreductase [Clostridiales bacterium]|nr:Gfo/Idh/MocA family oxidoreductase [Clostridiales bacterium]
MKKVKILLVAIGGYGANYIKELTEKNVTGVSIEGVCEVMPGIRERFPVIEEQKISVYRTLEEFYREREADLAVISTPMHLHYSQARYCLEHGSHVLLEKPVCTSIEDARKLEELEQETGRFVSVGYQLNYQRDVIKLKEDIRDGVYGKPILMKAMQAVRRGSNYYHRNNWAGKILSGGWEVNDSPFSNASAHQFQVMTYLLGEEREKAEEIAEVTGELYRANHHVENYDTAAVCVHTVKGVPIYYYTTHAMAEKKLGPVSEYRFTKGTIYYGKDFGEGPVSEYVAVMKDGRIRSYGDIPKGERLQKLYDAISHVREGGRPVCGVQCAIPHLYAVLELAKLPIIPIREEELEHVKEDGESFCHIRNLREIYQTCYNNQWMPSEYGVHWKKEREGEVMV